MTTLDSHGLLKGIGSAPDAFALIRADVAKAAESLAKKAIKSSKLTVAGLRAMQQALGADVLGVVLDMLSDSEVTAVAKRLDKHWSRISEAKAHEKRQHILALASTIEPSAPPARPAGPAPAGRRTPVAAPKTSGGRTTAMSARPSRN